MVGHREFMDVNDAWVQGRSISQIERQTGRDRKTIRRLLRKGGQAARRLSARAPQSGLLSLGPRGKSRAEGQGKRERN